MDINESSQERIQDVFIKHYHNSSDPPISRDEFIHAGWNQQTYLSYYRFSHMLYFAYESYSSQLNSPENIRKYAHTVLDDACKNFEIFFEKFIGVTLDTNAAMSFIGDSYLTGLDGTDEFVLSQHFISLLELFIGKQLAASEICNNVCGIFSDYYNENSGNFIDPRPIISKGKFLSAGWTEQLYQQYYTLTRNLYYSLMLFQNQRAPAEDYILFGTKGRKWPAGSEAKAVYDAELEKFLLFIQEQLKLTMQKTEDFNYIFDFPSGMVWCHPYDQPYTMNSNLCETLVFFVSYEQFLSWIEYEIGNQIVNSSSEASTLVPAISSRKIKDDASWYKLPYEELKKYRIQNTWPSRENARTELLCFNDFNSPDAAERFGLLIYEFIKQDGFDGDVVNRIDEYENCDFDLNGDVLYIYKGETKCFREHHDIDSVTATVYDRRGGTVDINVNCCCDCHKYFISESEFFHYRELYGIVCGLKVDRHSTGYAKFPMAEYSILRLYGYNVGKEDNLSDEERQNLLKILVENEYVKKPEIIKYLEMFIRMNQGRPEMVDSVSKWSTDLAYIRELGLEKQPKVLLGKIEYAR